MNKKTTKQLKKLELKKASLKLLTQDRLGAAAGGAVTPWTRNLACTCTAKCSVGCY
jgi:hypothetical protein